MWQFSGSFAIKNKIQDAIDSIEHPFVEDIDKLDQNYDYLMHVSFENGKAVAKWQKIIDN